MDRQQAHDYAAYAQQQQQRPPPQQQFGYSPQAQQFPGPPYGPPHPHLQQFPYHPHLQQQQPPPQVLSHAPPPPPHTHHLAPPPSAFAPHLPPPIVPPQFHAAGPPPPAAAPPSDPELHKRIDKLVEYSAKNGPDFEAMIRDKQQDNPDYAFLFGGEGHAYYRYKLYASTRVGSFNPNPQFAPHMLRPPPNLMMNGPPNPMMAPQSYFYDQQRHNQQAFGVYGRSDYDHQAAATPFLGHSGPLPLPPDVAVELSNVLMTLNGTKESIKGAKFWFMQRSIFAPALAEALRERVFGLDDPERQLHVIFLVNDILFDSSHRRTGEGLDNESLAFKPILGSMLARIYHNPQITEDSRMKLQQILQLWVSNKIYEQDTIDSLGNEMIGGQSSNSFPGLPKDLSTASTDAAAGLSQWQPERQGSVSSSHDQEHLDKHVAPGQVVPLSMPPQQFLPNSVPPAAFPGSLPIPSSVQPAIPQPLPHLLPGQAATSAEKLPPYPLFPPGLIPEMVRKMQIGSGVPYSPMSPLDIPTIIPPSTVPQSEILERVSKFFKEIGEVNPSEGPMHGSDGRDDDDYESSTPVRKGGACIPPPPNLQVDPETGAYADGSVDRKSGTGRLGLGATANPNEEASKLGPLSCTVCRILIQINVNAITMSSRIIDFAVLCFECSLFAAFSYGVASMAMVFINKAVLMEYSHSMTLLTMQQLATALLIHFGRKMGYTRSRGLEMSTAKKLLPVSLFYNANVAFALASLKGVNIPMYIAIKRLTPLAVLIAGFFSGKGKPSTQVILSVVLTAGGVVIAALGDFSFDLFGYSLALTSVFFQTMYLVLVEKSGAEDGLSSVEIMFYNSFLSLPFLLFLIIATGEFPNSFSLLLVKSTSIHFLVILILSFVMGIALNFTMFLCTIVNSALTTTIVGVLKGVGSTTLGFVLLGGVQVHGLNVTGLVINTTGGVWYSYAKYQEKKSKAPKRVSDVETYHK
ncbi:hypothetical protein ACLB2K_017840 [Fragaria x ananassa]